MGQEVCLGQRGQCLLEKNSLFPRSELHYLWQPSQHMTLLLRVLSPIHVFYTVHQCCMAVWLEVIAVADCMLLFWLLLLAHAITVFCWGGWDEGLFPVFRAGKLSSDNGLLGCFCCC